MSGAGQDAPHKKQVHDDFPGRVPMAQIDYAFPNLDPLAEDDEMEDPGMTEEEKMTMLVGAEDKYGSIMICFARTKGGKDAYQVNATKNWLQDARKTIWSPTCALCNVKVNTLAEDHDQWTDSIVWKIVLVVPEMPNKEYAQWATRNSWPFDIYFDPEGELSRALSKIDAKVSLPKSYIIDDAFNMLNVSSKASLLERRIVLDIYEDPEIVALPSMELPSMNKHIVDLSYYYELAKVLN